MLALKIMGLVRKHEAFLLDHICPIKPGRLIRAFYDDNLYVILEASPHGKAYCIPYEDFVGHTTIISVDIYTFEPNDYQIVS